MILYMPVRVQVGLLGKIREGTKKGGTREPSLRMMNVSYTGTLNITCVKQQ